MHLVREQYLNLWYVRNDSTMNKSIEESTERVQQQRTQLLSNVMAIILVLLVAAFLLL